MSSFPANTSTPAARRISIGGITSPPAPWVTSATPASVNQLDGIFAVAARHGVGLDIHLHEPGEMVCRLADGRLVDIGISGGKIAAIAAVDRGARRQTDEFLGRVWELPVVLRGRALCLFTGRDRG